MPLQIYNFSSVTSLKHIPYTKIHTPVKTANGGHFAFVGFAEKFAVARSEVDSEVYRRVGSNKFKAQNAVRSDFACIVKNVDGTANRNGHRQWVGVAPTFVIPVPTLNIAVNNLAS